MSPLKQCNWVGGWILKKSTALHLCSAPGKAEASGRSETGFPGAFQVPSRPLAISCIFSMLLCFMDACCFCKSRSCLSLLVPAPHQHVPLLPSCSPRLK